MSIGQLDEQNGKTVLETALRYMDAGLSILPIRGDGSKRPNLPSWKEFQSRNASSEEVHGWFFNRDNLGIAIMAKAGLEFLDIDAPELIAPYEELVERVAPGLLARLPKVLTPSGGCHYYYRCEKSGRSTKLAVDENGKTLIETRGEGGYVLAPPSPACCHPDNKPYVQVGGPELPDIPLLGTEERETLLDIPRSFSRKPEAIVTTPKLFPQPGRRVGEEFNKRATWQDILGPAGWNSVRESGVVIRPLTPLFFSSNSLSYDFDPEAGDPKLWEEFLRRVWDDDAQSIETLQEWFGYCLLPDTSQQKILLLVGPRRSGKGTIGSVLTGLVGKQNVAGPTLSDLASPFGLWPLLGKTLAIIANARLGVRTDADAVIERLLSISGEDTLTVDRKHLAPIDTKLAVRLVLLTNELPRLSDASTALASRMLLLRMSNSWYGKEDPRLTEKLFGELPAILLWAMEGLRRLHERGYFRQPDSGRDLLAQLEELGSPICEFIRECCVIDPEESILKAELYAKWKEWCARNGRDHVGDLAQFSKNLLAAEPSIKVTQPRARGTRVQKYAGIRLRADA
jgi:P4 family phage/plasmid primase-like protien